jgi:CheY-like chemotaxis protein
MANELPDKGTILIVDDMLLDLRILSSILTEQGYHVRSVTSGLKAIDDIRKIHPDLIFLDVRMPDIDGYEVCKRLKDDEQTFNIPIIFISANEEVVDKVRAFRAGGVDYITKPFQVDEVVARVETHMTLRRLQKKLQEINSDLERNVAERTSQLIELNTAYERFIPREILSVLQKENIIQAKLGDQIQQEMTIMVVTIRSFSALSESMTPQENFNFINSYLSRISPVVRLHHGFIDKYTGGGIMALFPHHPEDALQTAIDMLDVISLYNIHRKSYGYRPVRIGMSIHTGNLMLGIIGEEHRMQSTVISDTVTVVTALEQMTRTYEANIVLTQSTLERIDDASRYDYRLLDKIQVKGKRETLAVFEFLSKGTTINAKLATRELFEEGLELYHSRHFSKASVKFNNVIERNPEDKAAHHYLQRSAHLMVHGVEPEWIGAEIVVG